MSKRFNVELAKTSRFGHHLCFYLNSSVLPREWSKKWDAYLSAELSAFLLVVIVFFTAGNCAVFVRYYLTKSKNAQKLRFQGM